MPTINENAFRILLETMPDGFFVHDAAGRFFDVNARSCSDLGYTRDELLRMSVADVSRGADAAANAARWRDAPVGLAMHFQEMAIRKDGSTFPVEISLTCQSIDGQKLFFGVARDVSERDAARTAELKEAHERMEMAIRVGGLGIWDYDLAGDRLTCDEQWYRIMGRDPAQPVRDIASFRAFVHPDDVERVTEVRQTATRLVAEEQDYEMIFRIVRPDGALRWLRSAGHVVEDGDGLAQRVVGFVVDITEAHLARERLHQETQEDPLTGLANRRRLDAELTKACLHATRTGEPVTLAMIDVDHFKLYNDRNGHVAGDEALIAIAQILKGIARRPYDLAARYGGEEFVLLLPGIDDPETILQTIEDELAKLAIAHPASPVAPRLTVSCGCVVASELADTKPRDLLAACDGALYRAKGAGRNRSEVTRI